MAADKLARLPSLTYLDLSQTQISDFAVSKLLVGLEGLRGLAMASCPYLTSEAFSAKVIASSGLSALDLSGNRNIGPDALRWVDMSRNTAGDTVPISLKCLNVTGLRNRFQLLQEPHARMLRNPCSMLPP